MVDDDESLREVHLSALRSALGDGEVSGHAEAFDFEAFIASKNQ